jgi:hypothetical protein
MLDWFAREFSPTSRDRAAAHVPLPRITMSKSCPSARTFIMPEKQSRPQERASASGADGVYREVVKACQTGKRPSRRLFCRVRFCSESNVLAWQTVPLAPFDFLMRRALGSRFGSRPIAWALVLRPAMVAGAENFACIVLEQRARFGTVHAVPARVQDSRRIVYVPLVPRQT